MIVALDNTFFTLMVNPSALPSGNWETGEEVTHCALRVQALIDKLSRSSVRVLVPTPALAEAMTASEGLEAAIEFMQSHDAFEPATFDFRAAYELAELTKSDPNADRRKAGEQDSKQKVKFDRQIVAIAKVHGAGVLYTDDKRQSGFAKDAGLEVVHTWNLPLPIEFAQHDLDFPDDG